MPGWILEIDVIDGPVPLALYAITIACTVALLIRKPTKRWLLRLSIGVVIGAVAGVSAVVLVNTTNAFGTTISPSVAWWTGGAFAALGLAVVSLWDSALWRKLVAIALIVLSLLSAALGVNAIFGINRTVASVFGESSVQAIDSLPAPKPSASLSGPIYETWTPPADMPAKGIARLLTGDAAIPSSAGFKPRDATIYLPPAAQVKDGPALPLVVMMMGQPGNPEPTFIQEALDALASEHKGLAPIVIIADQLGDPGQDPVCADSTKYGGVATYFNQDIVAYAKAKLPIINDPKYWTIAGYSNGGACAFTWAAQHPDIWGNLISISGDEFPGNENPSAAVQDGFGGDNAAFEANKPAAQLQKNAGKFAGHIAVFTVGQNDPTFIPGVERAVKLAQDAGFTTTQYVVPGAGHVADALQGGLPQAFATLYPHLGLSGR